MPRCVILFECEVEFESGNSIRITLNPGEPSAHIVSFETYEQCATSEKIKKYEIFNQPLREISLSE